MGHSSKILGHEKTEGVNLRQEGGIFFKVAQF